MIIAAVLVVVGLVICFAAAAAGHFDPEVLSNKKYETKTYEVNETFIDITVEGVAEKISFKPSDDGKCRVVCLEEEKMKHDVSVKDDMLKVRCVDERDGRGRFSIGTKTPEITVYLPERDYRDLRISSETGDIEVPSDFSFEAISIKAHTADVKCFAGAKDGVGIEVTTGDITLSDIRTGTIMLHATTGRISVRSTVAERETLIRVTTGKVDLKDLNCLSLTSTGSTGDITMENVIASDNIWIKRDTGDVKFIGCDAPKIYVETDTGDVTGTLLSRKLFITETDTGKVEVPNTQSGGLCEIHTDTGRIKIGIARDKRRIH